MMTSPREMLYFSLMLLALLTTYLAVVRPDSQKQRSMLAEIDRKRRLLVSLRESTAGLEQVETKVNELSGAMESFRARLPGSNSLDDTLDHIAAVASVQSLQADIQKDLPTPGPERFRVLPVRMRMRGSFNGLYAFMLDLEQSRVPMRCTKLDMQGSDEAEGAITANIWLGVPYQEATK